MHGDRAQVGHTAVLHLHGLAAVTPRVQLAQTDSVASAQREQVATAHVVYEAEAVLLDQRDNAPLMATLG
jgi:hypothetical protein